VRLAKHILESSSMSNDIYGTVGRQLRVKRVQARLTMEKLAELADISTSFLAYIETGKKKPSLITVARLAGALNVPLSELFEESNVSSIPAGSQKTVGKLLKLLSGRTPAQTRVIIAMVETLSRKFPW